jgi:DNA-binding GntR family transcriptional regulator
MRRLTKRQQLHESLVAFIGEGPEHGRSLPSEREIASCSGANRMTVRLVLEELAASGLANRVQGRGTFIAGGEVTQRLEITSFTQDMLARGMRPQSRVIDATVHAASAAVARDLHLNTNDRVVQLRRVRLADDAPMCLETVELPADMVPRLVERDLCGSLYELLSVAYGVQIARAEQEVKATVAEAEEAAFLGVDPVSPALLIERVGTDRAGRPVERARSLYRGDRYTLRVSIKRGLLK